MMWEVKRTKLCNAEVLQDKEVPVQITDKEERRKKNKQSKRRDDNHMQVGKACEVKFRQSVWFTIFAGKMIFTRAHPHVHGRLADLFLNGAFWARRVAKRNMYEHV